MVLSRSCFWFGLNVTGQAMAMILDYLLLIAVGLNLVNNMKGSCQASLQMVGCFTCV
jgi:hypothetical protein